MLGLLLPATRLRWLAVPPLIVAAFVWLNEPGPIGMVSEDANLIGLAMPQGLAVSSAKPDRFLTEDWRRVFQADALLKPAKDPDGAAKGEARFVCTGEACLATMPGGTTVAHVRSVAAETALCDVADLIIEAAVFETVACPRHGAVITAGMLARHGTAALHADGSAKARVQTPVRTVRRKAPDRANGLRIVWTYEALKRPWQEHRRFSRAARDIAEAKPDPSRWREFNPRLKIAR
jgi:competence protein ComEC